MPTKERAITIKDLKELSSAIDKRFDAVDQRFDSISNRFDGLETEIRTDFAKKSDLQTEIRSLDESITNRVTGLVAGLESRLREDLATKFDLQTTVQASETRLVAVALELNEETKNWVGAIVEDMNHKFEAFAECFEGLPTRVTRHDEQISRLEESVSQLSVAFALKGR